MKLENLIDYLLNPQQLVRLIQQKNLNTEIESLLIYMQDALDLSSEIYFFTLDETYDNLLFQKGGINYIQLFPVDYAIELIESDLDFKGKGYSNLEIARRLLEFRLKDA